MILACSPSSKVAGREMEAPGSPSSRAVRGLVCQGGRAPVSSDAGAFSLPIPVDNVLSM